MSEKFSSPNGSIYSPMSSGSHDFEPFYAFDSIWNFEPGLHCHDFYELYLHIRGAKYYCIDHQVYPLENNQLIIVPPFTLHGHIGTIAPRDYERAFLYISPAALKKAGNDAHYA